MATLNEIAGHLFMLDGVPCTKANEWARELIAAQNVIDRQHRENHRLHKLFLTGVEEAALRHETISNLRHEVADLRVALATAIRERDNADQRAEAKFTLNLDAVARELFK